MCVLPICSVGYNKLEVEGAKYFAEALKVNTALTSVEYATARPHLPNLAKCQQPLTPVAYRIVSAVSGAITWMSRPKRAFARPWRGAATLSSSSEAAFFSAHNIAPSRVRS